MLGATSCTRDLHPLERAHAERTTDNADHVAALNILARGLNNRVSACGEFGGNARAQVNSGRLFETGSGQQQEPIEEITGLAP